jgi:hypothetical protein
MLRSENVRDDDVVEKAGDGLTRVGRVSRVSIAALALFLSRASFLTGHRVGEWTVWVRVVCATLCAVVRRGFRGKRYSGGSAGERKNKQLKLNLK